MQASRCLFHDIYDPTHFSHHIFYKMLLARMGSTILKNDFDYFRSKISLFWPPNGIKMSRFCHHCSLLLLCCSFGSLCVRFSPPSKTAWGSTPVLFSPPSPFCKNDGMHSTCIFMNVVCNFVLFMHFMLYTPLSSTFLSLFLKICFPPSLGSMIFENAWM